MRNPAVLFDFDGTLIDSMELIYEAFQASIRGQTAKYRPKLTPVYASKKAVVAR